MPFAIDEADKLYHRHMYVSLSLWQMWRTREECMTVESGLDHMPGSEKVMDPKIAPNVSEISLPGLEDDWMAIVLNGHRTRNTRSHYQIWLYWTPR